MATLILKQVPDSLYDALKERAQTHRRSLNSEAIICLEKFLAPQPFDVKSWLAETREIRRECEGFVLTDALLGETGNAGRA